MFPPLLQLTRCQLREYTVTSRVSSIAST
jgi:hypothetical protein